MKKWIIATLIIGILGFIVASNFQQKVEKKMDDHTSVYYHILND